MSYFTPGDIARSMGADIEDTFPDVNYECPECGDSGICPANVIYCGVCAGDTGKDVRIRHIRSKPL